MANPLRVKTSGATFQGLQIMTDAEMDYCVDVILKHFANTNSGLGTVNIDGATGTSIGTFVDTSRSGAVGDHPVADSPTTVTTYTFKQDITTTATEVITRPIEHSTSGIRQQNDTQLNDSIISRALSTCVATGIGSYALQPSSPSGTWTSIGTITNSVIGATNTTTLWRKTGGTAPTTVRPLKYQTSPSKSFKQMTDPEIQGFTNRFRNRIISTGIGTYKLQATAPSPGTWTTTGAAFSDTRNALANIAYTGSYGGSFTSGYAGGYTGTYTQAFVGSYTGSYGATYTRAFAGSYTGSYSTSYTGSYTGSYSRVFAGTYTGSYTGSFTGFYTGSYSRAFTGSYQPNFAGFLGPSYTGNYTGFFTGSYAGAYTRGFTGSYTGNYTGTFTGSYAGNYTRSFTGSYAGSYTGSFAGTYAGAYAGSYTGSFSGAYAGSYSSTFSGAYAGNYTGTTIQASTDTVSTVSLWVRTA